MEMAFESRSYLIPKVVSIAASLAALQSPAKSALVVWLLELCHIGSRIVEDIYRPLISLRNGCGALPSGNLAVLSTIVHFRHISFRDNCGGIASQLQFPKLRPVFDWLVVHDVRSEPIEWVRTRPLSEGKMSAFSQSGF